MDLTRICRIFLLFPFQSNINIAFCVVRIITVQGNKTILVVIVVFLFMM